MTKYFQPNVSGCPVPKLDEKGMSNWTSGAEVIAYTCLPNFFLEGDSDVMLANCEKGEWTPPPPACVRVDFLHSL